MQHYIRHISFALLFAIVHAMAWGSSNTDSLKQLLPQVPDSQRVVLMCDISFGYRLINSDSALFYSTAARQLAEQIQHPKALAQALNDQGIILADLNRYNEALHNYNTALNIRQQLNDSIGMGALHSKIGVIHQKRGAYALAIDHQLAALRIFEALQIVPYVAICQNNIGILHFNMGAFERALKVHTEALSTRQSLGDEAGIASSYCNLGNVYLLLEDTAAAISQYSKAIAIYKVLDDPEGLSTNLHNLGTCYLKTDPTKSLNYLQRALSLRQGMDDEKMIASTHSTLGVAYHNLGQVQKARSYFNQSVKLAQSANVLSEQLTAFESLAAFYRDLGNADSTYYYFGKYQALKDSAFNEGLRKDFAELQTLYETEKKEADITLLSEQNKVYDLKMKQKQNQLWMLALAFVAFVVVSATGYISYRSKQKARLTAGILREREAGMKAVIAATEAERARIARDLHDGVGQQLSGLKMGWQRMLAEADSSNGTIVESTLQLTQVLDETCNDVRRISHHMMPRSLSQYGLIPAVGDMLEKSFSPSKIKYRFEHFGMDKERFSAETELSIYRVMQELVNNVLRHAEATEVDVQLFKNAGQLIAIFEDNGIGLPPSGRSSDGIGMRNMASRLSTIGGIINFESDNGTRATIRVKISI